jgi:hypothetical protein
LLRVIFRRRRDADAKLRLSNDASVLTRCCRASPGPGWKARRCADRFADVCSGARRKRISGFANLSGGPCSADRASRRCRGGEKIGDVSRRYKLLQQDILMHRFIEARAFGKNENVDATRGIDDAMANILTAY